MRDKTRAGRLYRLAMNYDFDAFDGAFAKLAAAAKVGDPDLADARLL